MNTAQLAGLLPNPAGQVELNEAELSQVEGGLVATISTLTTAFTPYSLPEPTLPVLTIALR